MNITEVMIKMIPTIRTVKLDHNIPFHLSAEYYFSPILLCMIIALQGGKEEDPESDIPAVVSITRVPARPAAPAGGIKVRTDLGAVPASTAAPQPGRAGPPPLLRVGSPAPRPALPPMPRLKLGGARPPLTNPHHNGHLMNMLKSR